MSAPLSQRRLVSRVGIAIGMLFIASVVDTFVCGHMDGKTIIRALPGTRQAISGDLNQPVREPDNVRITFADPGLEVTILQVRGRFWRGELSVPPAASEGVYHLRAFSVPESDSATEPVYRIMVFSSPAALNASYPSLIRRVLGISPWWVAAATGPLLALCLVLAYRLTDEQEQTLAAEGLAPIVKLARRKDHWEVAAIVTPRCPVVPGEAVEVMDRNRQPLAPMTVTRIDGGLAFGQVDLSIPVKPDGLVRFSSVETTDMLPVEQAMEN